MKLNKKAFLAVAISALLAAPLAAQATEFTFSPTGTAAGNITGVSTIDQAPGSALAVGGTAAILSAATGGTNTGFTLYYQANLQVLQNTNGGIQFSNGTDGHYFTFIAGFGEKVVSAQPYPGTATFALDATNPVNYFKIYANTSSGNNLTGSGFGVGTLILSGRVTNEATSNFQVSSTTPVLLDQAGVDNWSGQKTVTGAGTTDLTVTIDMVNAGYFPNFNLANSVAFSFFNTSAVDPFKQVDPSQCINTDTSKCNAGGGINAATSIGTVNGDLFLGGANFLLQADANESVALSTRVPEPATTAMLGLGLALLGAFGISRKKNQA
ncbi:MAG: PEP-CTERM sorting domain-containing protein [Herminiimonas sp.]|nr:PEP-CTERM sorting domain-containing protein [Herminiimonas sp.]